MPTGQSMAEGSASGDGGSSGGGSGWAVPAKAAQPSPHFLSDELASFAMKCAVAEKELRDQTNVFHPSELWSPLKFALDGDNIGGAVKGLDPNGARQALWPEGAAQATNSALAMLDGAKLVVDPNSPGLSEPGLSKRDTSFPTQMVRRAVSFVFSDQIEDPNSPGVRVEATRAAAAAAQGRSQSPHTAIAA